MNVWNVQVSSCTRVGCTVSVSETNTSQMDVEVYERNI
jgi:hypothetical protein